MADQFQKLLDALVDGTISDEQFARLERRINEDASLRKRFLDYQNLCGNLEERALREGQSPLDLSLQAAFESGISNEETESGDSALVGQERDVVDVGNRWWGQSLGRLEHATVAVLLLVAIGLGVLTVQLRKSNGPSSAGDAVPPMQSERDVRVDQLVRGLASEQPVARLVEGAGFEFADREVKVGGKLPEGSYQLDRGDIGVRFRSGVEMSFSAPSKFDIVSDMTVALHLGKAWVHVPESGHGFRVLAPELDVEDHGTEFGMVVDQSRSTQVHVFGGEVRVHQAGQPTVPLHEGEAATWEDRRRVDLAAATWDTFLTRTGIAYRRYQQFSEQLRTDPATVFFYDFEKDTDAPDVLRDRAANDNGTCQPV